MRSVHSIMHSLYGRLKAGVCVAYCCASKYFLFGCIQIQAYCALLLVSDIPIVA